MTDFADLFAQSLVSGDAEPLAARLFHRSQMEDGLHLHIGAAAIAAETLALAALFDDRSATATAIGDEFSAVTLTGTTQKLFGHHLESPAQLTLTRHIWIETEGPYALRLTAITDWAGLATAAGLDLAALAATLGARHPTHRPLGELASGRGQLTQPPIPLSLRRHLTDAHLTPDTSAGPASLSRLQGHTAGRRVSLPLSQYGDTMLVDEMALAATAHRPFYDQKEPLAGRADGPAPDC
jgi:hypothetical protein